MAGSVDQLTPFDSERAKEAGRRSGEVRRQRAAAQRLKNTTEARELADHLATFGETFHRDDIGTHSAAVAAMILARIAAGQIPIRHAADAADLLTALHNLTRLEEGQATSHTLNATVDAGTIVARIEQLRGELTPGDSNP